MYKKIIEFIQEKYNTKEFITLHEPKFIGNEKKYTNETIDSTFVSSVGKFVDTFEQNLASYLDIPYCVATVNGTSALHTALKILEVDEKCEVITQPLTFIATANAISYCNAKPVFIDVDLDTYGLSPLKLKEFLKDNTINNSKNECINKTTKKVIKACIPMHTFGHPCKIDEIVEICKEHNIYVLEDAAESLGSKYKGQHTGTFGDIGIISFNGNKIITTGGGGAIVTRDKILAQKAKHLTTTAKLSHSYEYIHDEIGFNYRMPNINAALGVAQLEMLDSFLKSKQELAKEYKDFFTKEGLKVLEEPQNAISNFWLNGIIFDTIEQRNEFLKYSNENQVMTRPIWRLMNRLEMFKNSQCSNLDNSLYLEERIVNIPSSVRL